MGMVCSKAKCGVFFSSAVAYADGALMRKLCVAFLYGSAFGFFKDPGFSN